MMRLKPREEPQRLPFTRTRRQRRLAERQKRMELVMNRSLDRAGGFSWSADRRSATRPFPASLLALPLHAKVAAAASVAASFILMTVFLMASRSGLPTLPPIIWVQASATPEIIMPVGSSYQEVSRLRMQIAEIETAGAAETPELQRLREDLMFERALLDARTRASR
jgi:hypothetical protein